MNIDEHMHADGLQLRPASGEDLPALAHDPDRLGLLRDRARRRARGLGELLVACVRGTPVGHIYIWLEPAEEPELAQRLSGVPLLMNLWVRDDYRNRGIGTRLAQAAESWLHQRGYRSVALGVTSANRAATRLYQRLLYDPWPYGDLRTYRGEYLPSGELVGRHAETCAVLVKELGTR